MGHSYSVPYHTHSHRTRVASTSALSNGLTSVKCCLLSPPCGESSAQWSGFWFCLFIFFRKGFLGFQWRTVERRKSRLLAVVHGRQSEVAFSVLPAQAAVAGLEGNLVGTSVETRRPIWQACGNQCCWRGGAVLSPEVPKASCWDTEVTELRSDGGGGTAPLPAVTKELSQATGDL